MWLKSSHLIIIRKTQGWSDFHSPSFSFRDRILVHGLAMEINPDGHAPIRLGATRITLIVPKDDLKEDSL